MDIPIVAGAVSTVVFAVSNLPMLRKALRTRNVSSYSLTSLVMINAANVVYSLYVFTLPIGPIWALHTFYLVSCAILLVLYLRQRGGSPDKPASNASRAHAVEPPRAIRTQDLRGSPSRRPAEETGRVVTGSTGAHAGERVWSGRGAPSP